MMFKHIIKLATISIMAGSVVTLFIVALSAMLNGGQIILDFNSLNEGWFEVVLLGIFIIPTVIHLSQAEKESTKAYLKRKTKLKLRRRSI